MILRDYLIANGVQIDGLCGASFSQAAGSFSDTDHQLENFPLSLYIHEQYGRFGNNIHQVLNALVVARRLSIKFVYCNFFIDEMKTPYLFLDDIIVQFGKIDAPTPPQISATMFQLQGFEKLIVDFNLESVKRDAERISRQLFPHHKIEYKNRDEKTIAVHFRSGDIFGASVSPIYTQPPLSYYTKAADHIISTMKDIEFHLVYEDELNPCIQNFKKFLSQKSIVYHSHSSRFEDDARFMVSADCIVASYSSFCDVLALMNENLIRWYAFRSISAYEGIDLSIAHNFSAILRSSGVEVYRAIDRKNLYTQLGSWKFSSDQVEMMLNYPEDDILLNLEN